MHLVSEIWAFGGRGSRRTAAPSSQSQRATRSPPSTCAGFHPSRGRGGDANGALKHDSSSLRLSTAASASSNEEEDAEDADDDDDDADDPKRRSSSSRLFLYVA